MQFNHHPVLVLNRSWTAVNVTTLCRAVTMLFKEHANGEPKARIIDPSDFSTYTWADWSKLRPDDDEDSIKGVSDSFKIPEIILLTEYDKVPNYKVKFSRRMIHKRDNWRCQYCGITPGSVDLSIDHVIPRAQGGETTWKNCVSCCFSCNQIKRNRTPEQAKMKLLKQPKKPRFSIIKVERKFVPKSWRNFIDHLVSQAFWDVELENDN